MTRLFEECALLIRQGATILAQVSRFAQGLASVPVPVQTMGAARPGMGRR